MSWYIQNGPKSIIFYELNDESYDIVDLYLFRSRCYGYEDSYNYYDINVNNVKKVIMNMLLDIMMQIK